MSDAEDENTMPHHGAGKRKRIRYSAAHVEPDADMEAFIAVWEKLTGKTFTGNRRTGFPEGITPEDDAMRRAGSAMR